jgi:hypothetical protein
MFTTLSTPKTTIQTTIQKTIQTRRRRRPASALASDENASEQNKRQQQRMMRTDDDDDDDERTLTRSKEKRETRREDENVSTNMNRRKSIFMVNMSWGCFALAFNSNVQPTSAMFNSGLDVPIEEPLRAVAVVLAVKVALQDIANQNEEFRKTCDAPVYNCDLSQLNVKCATRVSGPMTRALPTILETYGLDAYEVEALKQSIQELETQLKANNARVAVNFKAPAEYFGLIDRQIDELLAQIPEDAMTNARDMFEKECDLSVPAEQPAELDCRIARAVSQGKRPSGGVS